MPAIGVNLDGDHEAFGERVGARRLPVIHTTADWQIDPLEHGMQSGATSLMVAIPALVGPVRHLVLAETSLNCWMMASTLLAGKFHDEVTQPGWAVLSPAARALIGPRFAEAVRRVAPELDQARVDTLVEMILDGFGAGR